MLLQPKTIAFTISEKILLLIISKLQMSKFCPIFKIISRRWILSQGNRGAKNQSVSKMSGKVTK